jgi:hypothetical protein
MDDPIVPSRTQPTPITRREFLGGLSDKRRDAVKAICISLFCVSATTAQGTILAIILYLIGVI